MPEVPDKGHDQQQTERNAESDRRPRAHKHFGVVFLCAALPRSHATEASHAIEGVADQPPAPPAPPGRLFAMLLKIVFAFVPIAVTAMMQTIAMSESMSAYSTIVAASSFLTKWRTREVMRAIASSTEGVGWCVRQPGVIRRQERTRSEERRVGKGCR